MFAWCITFVSGLDILANVSSSGLNSTDMLSYLIAEQSRKCPYIALCHTSNRSVFKWDANRLFPPCCKECSCEDTCVKDGSCCPDYFIKDNTTEHGQWHDGITTSATAKSNLVVTDRKECVKVQHGNIENEEGYLMST